MVIPVPRPLLKICADYHSGQDSIMYAVSSVGGLYRGQLRPIEVSTDRAWDVYLWEGFAAELSDLADETDDSDIADWAVWAGRVALNLEEEYVRCSE